MRASSVALVFLMGCGPSWQERGDGEGPGIDIAKPPPSDPDLERRKAFADPGGMWMPEQLSAHADTLRSLGVELEPGALSDPLAAPLGAVIWLGGCSASFVSPDGLVITNHHCATGALQFNSTPEQNLLENGYLAKARADERPAGPTQRVYVTERFEDVTARVRAGLEAMSDAKARSDAVEQRGKELVAACESAHAGRRCNMVSFFGGESFRLIQLLELRDVRLVYAPAEGVGNFGGEIDNWRWPRHSGDYSFFRAYVAPDGSPADFDAKNVPYRPRHHLRIAKEPLRAHDFALVAGYPGQTNRLRIAAEVADAVEWQYPRRLRFCDEFVAMLEALTKNDEELGIKARSLLRGLWNTRTNTEGMLDGLVKGGLRAQKVAAEAELRAWIAQHQEHAPARVALDELTAAYARYREKRDQEAATAEAVRYSTLLNAADLIVHMAEERPKPDAERHPDLQQRNHKRLEQMQEREQKNYDRRLELAKLKLALQRAGRLPKGQRPELLTLLLGPREPAPDAIEAALAPMYAATELEQVERRLELFRSATLADLKKSKDPFIVLGLQLRPILQAMEDRADAFEGATLLLRPPIVAAMRDKAGGRLAPDANGTLRITYGTVRGYSPKPGAPVYEPFTKLSEMVAKHTGQEPFHAPAPLIDAAKTGPFGPYLHPDLGEVPVDFLTDLDITGGNSGSATLNRKGELVGLAFDGNYEAMASDWQFMPDITRSIHVDIRYVLWLMDRVDGADHLLKELGVDPALP